VSELEVGSESERGRQGGHEHEARLLQAALLGRKSGQQKVRYQR
jgi:hypothetical protein